MVDPEIVARKSDHPLNIAFLVVMRIQEDHHVSAVDLADAVRHLVDEQAVLILQHGQHAGAFDAYRLIEEDDDEGRNSDRDDQIPQP